MASSYLAILVLVLLLLGFSGSAVAVASSYIVRTTEQQIIATVAPAAFADADDGGQSDAQGLPFLASPSGSFAAYLRRAAVGDGGGNGDVCYVEVVQQQGGGGGTSSVWESDCTPVGGTETCDLAFSPVGLELFAGGHSLWDTAVDSDPAMLSLDGAGDMRIVSRDGVTVWRTRDEPWTGWRCGASALPVSSPSTATGAKLLTLPAATSTLASPWGSGFTFGDQTAPPLDTLPDQMLPPPPPADDDDDSAGSPDLVLPPPPPPPSDPSTDWPDLQLPPPPADMYPIPESPELPLYSSPPPADMHPIPETPEQPLYSSPPPSDTHPIPETPERPLYSSPPPSDTHPIPETPEQPLYSSPPPADTHPIPESPEQPLHSSPPPAPPTPSDPPQTPLPPVDTPPLVPSPGAGIATPPASSGEDNVPLSPPPHGTPHPHHLPVGASPPTVPGAVAPISGGHGPLPLGQGQHGQGQHGQGQGVFGQQQNQLLNGGGQPLEDSAGGWSGRERGVSLAWVALVALAIAF
ncbi:extensin-like [Hordeum vulgare subsp. vulgare]|nr:extensin-like [Hordeum vulgare subsp. vulgare]BAK03096.1 predicted protein [Hordeum vulgare subsp. vulgare]